jgi:alpha-1,6-mannosyltransferase
MVQFAGLAAATVIIGWLFATIHSRRVVTTAGWAMLALALLGPILHPWYLAWGLVPLAVAPTPRQRATVLGVTAAGVFLALQHCSLMLADHPEALDWVRGHASVVAIVGYVGATALVTISRRRRSSTDAVDAVLGPRVGGTPAKPS